MPQARLPDVGHAFDAYRKKAVDNIKNDQTSCIGSLYSLNSLLPEEYRIEINTQEYKKKLDLETNAKCSFCTELTDMKKIRITNHLLALPIGNFYDGGFEKIWVCEKCKKINKLLNTTVIKKIPKEPYLLKVVPYPPIRKDGLMDRRDFNKKFEQWAWTFLVEVEAQMAQFRDDNWKRGDEDFDYQDINTKLEEEQVA